MLSKLTPLVARPIFMPSHTETSFGENLRKALVYTNPIVFALMGADKLFLGNSNSRLLKIIAASTFGYQYVNFITSTAKEFILSKRSTKRTSNYKPAYAAAPSKKVKEKATNKNVDDAIEYFFKQINELVSNTIFYSSTAINYKPLISVAVSYLPETTRSMAGRIVGHAITASVLQTANDIKHGLDSDNECHVGLRNSLKGIFVCTVGLLVKKFILAKLEERLCNKYLSAFIAGLAKGGVCHTLNIGLFYGGHPNLKGVYPSYIFECSAYEFFNAAANNYLGENPGLSTSITAETIVGILTNGAQKYVYGFFASKMPGSHVSQENYRDHVSDSEEEKSEDYISL